MMFWIRTILFGLLLAGLAYYLLANQESLSLMFDSSDSAQVSSTDEEKANDSPIDEPTQHVKKPVKTENAAAQGLSRFYANLHGEFGEEARIRNNVVYLPEPNGSLVEILQAKAMITRPLKASWRGMKESRPFRQGETLFQKLSEYAEKEGLEVIWWLNRDLIIKDPFRIDKETLYTAYLIGNAVEGHFPNGVTSYFCYKQRSIVLVDQDIDYLNQECEVLTPETLKRHSRRY